jgi:hypothetical protein
LGYVKTNYYTKTEVDNAIANIDIPEGEIVDEVFVGSEQPSDENIKIWVNPNEQLSFATTAYVDEAIANIDIPESGGGAAVYYCEGIGNNLTDNDKAKFQEFYEYALANNKLPCDIWIQTSGNGIVQITRFFANANMFILNTYPLADKVFVYNCSATNGILQQFKYYANDIIMKDWRWSSAHNDNSINDIGGYSKLKIVGYWDDNTSRITTFDVSTSYGNVFFEENGTSYHCVGSNGGAMQSVEFYNESGNDLSIYVYSETNTYSFKVLGYYYWG